MSEADWWLCPECTSLNSLYARKCYKCRKRKPKGAVKASEVLGYYPVVSWDGKVTLVKPMTAKPGAEPEVAAPAPPVSGAEAAPLPPPLREPARRSIAALTPQYPEPVRVTYTDAPPAPMPVPRVPMGPGPMAAPPVPPVPPMPPNAPMPGQMGAVPGQLAAAAVPMGPAGPMPASAPPGSPWPAGPVPPGVAPRPMVPMGPGPATLPPVPVPAGVMPPLAELPPPGVAVSPARQPMPTGPAPAAPEPLPPPPTPSPLEEQWPHWRALLDGPTPDAERLRVQSEDAALADRLAGTGPVFRPAGSTSNGEVTETVEVDASARSFVPWPEADRLPEPDEKASEDPGPAPG